MSEDLNKNLKNIQAIRGMNDLLPSQSGLWDFLETSLKNIAKDYGYLEIRTPILESTDLFKRSIGEVTDIVEKEMYSFLDKNGDALSLRPEGTASVVRAGIEHGLFYNQIQKLFYLGPMYRHERPQKGRYRQFHQFGLEIFGIEGPEAEAEMIMLAQRLFKKIGLLDQVKLEINTLGELAERQEYKKVLISYFEGFENLLDQDSKNRLYKNPLRILDSKNPQMQELINQAPKLIDFLSPESLSKFNLFKKYLDAVGINYEVNLRLVRGLDYYSHTVFEWVTSNLGAQGTVLAGGRYDGLIEQLGGQKNHAVGCAFGIERLVLLLESLNIKPSENSPDIYFVAVGPEAVLKAFEISEKLRSEYLSEELKLKIDMNLAGGSFKSQFKKADKSGAKIALVLAEDEIKNNKIIIKFLRINQEQVVLDQKDLSKWLDSYGFHLLHAAFGGKN